MACGLGGGDQFFGNLKRNYESNVVNRELRDRVLGNIEESRLAREASNYSEFAKFENSLKGVSNPNINRRQALNQAKDSASIPRSQQPTRQWSVGGDITKKGGNYKNYEYSDNATHYGRYYEYDTPQGKKIIVEHTNDLEQGLHTHAGEVPKGANPLTYDFKNPDNRYKPINKATDHHIRYTDKYIL